MVKESNAQRRDATARTSWIVLPHFHPWYWYWYHIPHTVVLPHTTRITKPRTSQCIALSLSVLRSRPWHCPLSWFFCHASVCWQRQLWQHTFAMAPCLGLPFQIVPTPLVSPFKLHTVQTCTGTWMRKAARFVLFLKGSHLPRVLSEVNVSNKWP